MQSRSKHSWFTAVVRRPIATSMLLVLCLSLGLISYQRTPLALFPRGFQAGSLWIQIPYPGSSPREAETEVAIPAEESIRTIPGIKELFTRCFPDRVSITIQFQSSVDMDTAYAEVKDRLERARPRWPDAVRDFFVFRFNTNTDLPVQWFAVLFGSDNDPSHLAEKVIQQRLEALDGVARVEIHGLRQESIRVRLNRERIESAGLDLFSLVENLRRQHFVLPAGRLEEEEHSFLVRVDARLKDIASIADIPVTDELRLGDISTSIGPERERRRQYSRVDGKQALVFSVTKESSANTVGVCTLVDEELERLQVLPQMAGMDVLTFFSQKEAIVGALDNVKQSALFGGLLAVVILNLFLRRISVTLVVALAIPASILIALIPLYFMGRSFNVLSLAGFTLAVGMLVDNAIVVIENVARRRRLGDSPEEAASRGAGEVAMAVTMATLTTLVVFVPLVFLSEDKNSRLLLGEIAGPISFSLLASLVTALVFLPVVGRRLLPKLPPEKVRESGAISGVASSLARPLQWVLEHRFASVVGCLLLFSTVSIASELVPKGFEGSGDGGTQSLRIDLEFQGGFNEADADRAVSRIEAVLDQHREEFGIANVSCDFTRRGGRVVAYFEDDVDQELRRALPQRLQLPRQAGVKTRIGRESGSGEQRDVRIELSGRDTEVLAGLAEQLVELLDRQPSLLNVRSDLERGREEVRVILDRDAAMRRKVSTDSIRGALAWGFAGTEMARVERGEREIPLIVEYEEREDSDLEDLRRLALPSMSGEMVPLKQVAELEVARGPAAVIRSNGLTIVGVNITPGSKNSFQVSREIREVLEAFPLPEGVQWNERYGYQDFRESQKEILQAFGLAVVLVYLLMGVLFESAFLPLSVLLSIPFAVVGAYWLLAITQVPFDASSMAGLVILAGIVVNNAIVLVDQINRNRDHGMDRTQAILTGTRDRLRPILMTALTTISGLIPMALPNLFGTAGGLFSYRGLALCVLGGLSLSTVLTLFVVPLFYTLWEDLGRSAGRAVARGMRIRRGSASTAPKTP